MPATLGDAYESTAATVDCTSRFTPRTVFAQDATATAQTRIVASEAIRGSFMDGVSLSDYMNAEGNGPGGKKVPSG